MKPSERFEAVRQQELPKLKASLMTVMAATTPGWDLTAEEFDAFLASSEGAHAQSGLAVSAAVAATLVLLDEIDARLTKAGL